MELGARLAVIAWAEKLAESAAGWSGRCPMRRQMAIIFTVLCALGSQPASAQFAVSPRGIFGLMTRPLRDMLGHLRGRHHHHHHHRHRLERAGQAEQNGSEKASGADLNRPSVKEARATQTTQSERSVLNAYDDVLGYAFWPDEYAGKLNGYGYDSIAAAIIGPLPPAPATVGSAANTGQNSQSGEAGGIVPACGPAIMPVADRMTERFTQRLPDVTKLHSYDALRTKVSQGAKTIESNCHTVLSSSPVTRLAALRQRLWAVHDAVALARHSLKTFYNGLSDKEKRAFDNADQVAAKPGDAAAPNQRECAVYSAGATRRMLTRIQQTVRPRRDQLPGLNSLRQTSARMEKLMLALCAQKPARTPLERLDAANQRLVTMNFAAANVQVALNVFYASLDPRQKAQFDSLND